MSGTKVAARPLGTPRAMAVRLEGEADGVHSWTERTASRSFAPSGKTLLCLDFDGTVAISEFDPEIVPGSSRLRNDRARTRWT